MKKLRRLLLTLTVALTLSATPALAATTVTMHAPNYRTIQIWDYEVPAYQNVGWYTYPVTLMTAVDGRQCVIATDAVFDWYRVGWNSTLYPRSYIPDYGDFNKITCSDVYTNDKGACMTYTYNTNQKWNYVDLLRTTGYKLYNADSYTLTYYHYTYKQMVMISADATYTTLSVTYMFK